MSPVSLLPIPLLLAWAFAVVALLDRWFPVHIKAQRASTIDGLRGFLAFGVFLHHACIWYFFTHSGVWRDPPSPFYGHLGSTSVTLFFMITGYLFFGKLLAADGQKLDWLRLYVSRALRILPVFVLLSLASVVVIVAIKRLGLDAGNPELLAHTARKLYVTAGVTWTLDYEWNFYFALPLFAALLWRRLRGQWPWLLLAVCYLALEDWAELTSIYSAAFAGGLVAVWAGRWPWLVAWCRTHAASALVLGLMVGVVTGFDSAYQPLPMALLGVAFVLVANGASVFGQLNLRLCRVFGEITYSLYLLHGLVLFLFFRFVVGLHTAATLSPVEHWLLVGALTPVLVAVAFFSFRWVEAPMMAKTDGWTRALRERCSRMAALWRPGR